MAIRLLRRDLLPARCLNLYWTRFMTLSLKERSKALMKGSNWPLSWLPIANQQKKCPEIGMMVSVLVVAAGPFAHAILGKRSRAVATLYRKRRSSCLFRNRKTVCRDGLRRWASRARRSRPGRRGLAGNFFPLDDPAGLGHAVIGRVAASCRDPAGG